MRFILIDNNKFIKFNSLIVSYFDQVLQCRNHGESKHIKAALYGLIQHELSGSVKEVNVAEDGNDSSVFATMGQMLDCSRLGLKHSFSLNNHYIEIIINNTYYNDHIPINNLGCMIVSDQSVIRGKVLIICNKFDLSCPNTRFVTRTDPLPFLLPKLLVKRFISSCIEIDELCNITKIHYQSIDELTNGYEEVKIRTNNCNLVIYFAKSDNDNSSNSVPVSKYHTIFSMLINGNGNDTSIHGKFFVAIENGNIGYKLFNNLVMLLERNEYDNDEVYWSPSLLMQKKLS